MRASSVKAWVLSARAGVPLELHQPTVERMRAHYDARGMELNAARLRMATLPATAEVGAPPGPRVPWTFLSRCSLVALRCDVRIPLCGQGRIPALKRALQHW
jgi:molybdopterin-biosynthesis enzyme MoeA-like protein